MSKYENCKGATLMKRLATIVLFALFSLVLVAYAAPVQQVPAVPNPALYKFTDVATGLTSPVLVTHAGDSSGRLFVVEQGGLIKIIENGAVLPTPFLNISTLVSRGSEQGLLGLAFHPNYAQNGRFFINYTNTAGDTIIAQYTVSANRNIANTTGSQVLFVDQPYGNHNGGHLAFGRDGWLYVGMGDGGSGGDPENRAQNDASLLGKMLRINVDVNPISVQIWAKGLRNPWRWSFDRLTGDVYIADVGQGQYEEVNFWSAANGAGANYGWKVYEGNHQYSTGSISGAVFPFVEYNHSSGNCSVTGGYVYRGSQIPALQGVYFYGDFCSGQTWTAFRSTAGTWQNQAFKDTSYLISSFGEDQNGELYLTDLNGRLVRLDLVTPPTATPVTPTLTPVPPTETPVTPTETPITPEPTAIPTETPVTTDPTLTVDVMPPSANTGDMVLVSLNVSNVQNLYGLQVECLVNPAVLNGVDLLESDFSGSNSFVVDRGYQSDGSWLVAASRLQPSPAITGSAVAFKLAYSVVGMGSSGVNCAALAVDQNGDELPLTVVNGTFMTDSPVVTEEPTPEPTATEEPTLEPTIEPTPIPTETPLPTTEPVSGGIQGILAYQSRMDQSGITVRLLASGNLLAEVLTDSTGHFIFENVMEGAYVVEASAAGHITIQQNAVINPESQGIDLGYEVLKAGDTDGNQTIDLADAAFVGANFNVPVPPAPVLADLNLDGKVDIRDLVLIGGNFGLVGPQLLP